MIDHSHTLKTFHLNTATLEMRMIPLRRHSDRFFRLHITLRQGVIRC